MIKRKKNNPTINNAIVETLSKRQIKKFCDEVLSDVKKEESKKQKKYYVTFTLLVQGKEYKVGYEDYTLHQILKEEKELIKKNIQYKMKKELMK